MARKIQDPTEAAQAPNPEPGTGVVFIKNQPVEVIRFKDGSTHQFGQSRTVVDNPELIEKLREAAALPGNPYRIFEA